MTIANTMPSLIDEIATHTGKSADEIRKLGAEGKLSIKMLVDALGGRFEAIMKKVAGMPTTVRDALTNVSSAFGEYIGKHNEANQITATLAASVELLGKNIDTISNVALVGAGAGLVRYAGGMAFASAQTAIKGAQARKAALDELALAQAQAAQTEATLTQITAMRGLVATNAQVTTATLANEAAQKRLAAAQAAIVPVGRSLLSVLGGPVGIAITAGLAATALFDLGGSAKAAAVDVDKLTLSLGSLNAEQLAFRRQQAEEKPRELQEKAAEATRELRALEREYAALLEMFQTGRGVTAEGLENVNKTLVEQRAAVADANQAVEKAVGVMAKLDEASRVSAAGVSTLNEAATNDAAKSYLERLADRALLAGLKTQREQLEALVKAGKLVFSEPGLKRVREYADAIDRANAASKTKKDPGADYVQNLKERIELLGKIPSTSSCWRASGRAHWI